MYVIPLMQMARQRSSWAPQRLGRVVWSILNNLRGQIELFHIFSLPAFKSLVLHEPIFSFRHLSRDFLFRGLSASERTASILHHYRFLFSRLSKRSFCQFGPWEIPVIEHQKSGRNFAVTLGLPSQSDLWEGEGVLQLLVEEAPVYQLGFTIVPGWVMHSEQRDVVFVQRLQGVKGCFGQVSAATRAFNDVAPPLLLVTVLQGIAAAWGIREMACVSAKSQAASKFNSDERSSALFKEAYDDFFLQLGATRVSADFFSLSFPIGEKPIELIGNGHKARTRRKRALRREIADRVCETILKAA
jgi:uncharacterized protein VirK/YbjX